MSRHPVPSHRSEASTVGVGLFSLAPYLPPHLVTSSLRGTLPAPGSFQTFRGTLLMADLSGFTHLTEQLQGRGRIGAEEVTDIVNRVLRPMVECIDRLSGSILQFGGDAVFALFQSARHATRSILAASELMDILREHGQMESSIGPLKLEMKVVLSTGKLTVYHVQAGEQTIYLPVGPVCSRLDELARIVCRGEILVGSELVHVLGAPLEPDPRGGLLRVPWPAVVARRPPTAAPTHPIAQAVQRYLPPEVRGYLERAPVEGEYRNVASAFMRFRLEPVPDSPEGTLELFGRFFALLTDVLKHYGGVILKYDTSPLCDSLLVVFGLPEAHEDDGLRAALAALTLRDRVRQEIPAMRHSTAVSIGVVVAADVGGASRRTLDIMGDSVNLAARILEGTPWGEVRLTSTLARQCETSIRIEALGPFTFRGKDTPVELHRAIDRRLGPTSAAPGRRLPPFVGREKELRLIGETLTELSALQGRVLAINAEAGGGKSRLWLEVRGLLRQRQIAFHYGSCPSYAMEGYTVFADLLRRMVGIDEGMSRAEALERTQQFAAYGLSPREVGHLENMMGFRSRVEIGRGAELKAGNFQATRRLFRMLAASGPVVVALEDLHWADPTSLELIEHLGEDVAGFPMLLVLSHRPDFTHRLGHLAHFRQIRLRPLSMEAGIRLVEALLPGAPVPDSVSRRLVEQSGGVPFYLEELARAVVEQGWLLRKSQGWVLAPGAGVESLPLPDSIDAVLSARLHRLPLAIKRVAQRAAVIGRSFSYRLLESVCEEDIHAAVDGLRVREIIFELPTRSNGADPRDRELIFKHALTREVAYQSLLERHRQVLHGRIAQSLRRLHHDDPEDQVERLAWHFAASDAPLEAVPYLTMTARKALSQGRFADGSRDASQALAILARQPHGGEPGLRFPLLLCRGDAAAWEGNYAEVLAVYLEAEQVAPGEGARAEVYGRRSYIYWAMGELEQARESAEEGLALAIRAGAKAGQARCRRELGRAQRELGRLTGSRRQYEEALEISRQLADTVGQAIALRGLGATWYELGQIEAATATLKEALELTDGQGDRRGESEALLWLGRCAYMGARLEEAGELFERCESIARDLDDSSTRGLALCGLIDLQLWRGDVESARALLARAGDREEAQGVRATWAELRIRALLVGLRSGRRGEGEPLARVMLEVFRRQGSARGMLIVLNALVSAALGAGAWSEARGWADQAWRAAEGIEAPPWIAFLAAHEGLLRAREGRADWEAPLREGLELAQALKLPLQQRCVRQGYGEALTILGETSAARPWV